jgi:hypothetical protein
MNARDRRLARRRAEREALEKGDTLTAAASGSTSLPLSDRDASWDASAAKKSLSEGQYGKAHFWRDPDGDADALSSYKLPFASNSGGTLTAVWKGVTAAAGAVQGARGGVSIPSADVSGVKSRIASYYRKAAKKYGDDGIKPPWEASAEDEAAAAAIGLSAAAVLLARAELGPGIGETDHEIGAEQAEFARRAKEIEATLAGEAVGEAFADGFATSERAALAAVTEALLHNPKCSCGHSLDEHTGADGPCSHEDGRGTCSCGGYSEMATEDSTPADPRVELTLAPPERLTFTIAPASVEEFLAGVTLGGAPVDTTDGGVLAAAIRASLQDFTIEVDTSTIELPRVPETFEVVLPDELAPGETLPSPNPSPDVPVPAQRTGADLAAVRWTASIVPEAALTDDGRAIAPGALTWRELPLTLMAMVETTEGGHNGALVAGRIDEIWREGNMVRASGIFDDAEYGREIARMVGEGTLRGVSVDLAIHKYEVGPRADWFDEDGNWAPREMSADEEEPTLLDILFGGEADDTIFVITEAVIGATTVCPFQAFADATIELAASLVSAASPAICTVTQQAGFTCVAARAGDPGPLTASVAGLAPVRPPAEWFADPAFEGLSPLTVTEDGRVFGHAAAWDTCHIGIPDVCTTAPTSETDYAYFLLKAVECEGGESVPCGTITLDTGHADRRLRSEAATAHYDHTGTAAADVTVGEDEHGIWVAGALRPDIDAEKARDLRGAVLSGDWRNVDGNLELVALLAVNVPGFPVPRARALVAAGDEGAEVLALVAAGIHVEEQHLSEEDLVRIDALRAAADGRVAALAARVAG